MDFSRISYCFVAKILIKWVRGALLLEHGSYIETFKVYYLEEYKWVLTDQNKQVIICHKTLRKLIF